MKIFEQRIGTVEKQMTEVIHNRSFRGNNENNLQEIEFVQKNYNEVQSIKKEMASQNNFLQSNVNLKHTDFKMTQGHQNENKIQHDTMKSSNLNNNVFNQNLYNMEQQNSQENFNNESININERVSENSIKKKFLANDPDMEEEQVDEMEGSYGMEDHLN